MAEVNAANDCITAIVTFECEPEQQEALAEKVRAYIKNFISQQDGLISSHLHLSLCGKRVVNYAQWQSMEHFKAFGEKAKGRPELPDMLAFKPYAFFYKVYLSVDGPSSS